jgi:hypothetical protein
MAKRHAFFTPAHEELPPAFAADSHLGPSSYLD